MHRTQPVNPGKFVVRPAATLNRNHQRNLRSFGRLIQTHNFLDAIVFNKKILGPEPVDDFALRVFRQRGDYHYIRLAVKGCILGGSATE